MTSTIATLAVTASSTPVRVCVEAVEFIHDRHGIAKVRVEDSAGETFWVDRDHADALIVSRTS